MVQAWSMEIVLVARPRLQTAKVEEGRAAPVGSEGPHQAHQAMAVLAAVACQMGMQEVPMELVATHQGALAAQEALAGGTMAAPTTILEMVGEVEEAQAAEEEEEQVAQENMEALVEEAPHGLLQT